MNNLMDRYKFGIGCDEDLCPHCKDEFKDFVFGFLIGSYPRFEIINWIEEDSEIIRVDVENYYETPLKTSIDMKVTKMSDGSYYQITIHPKQVLEFDVSTAVNSMYCIVTKNESYS